MDGKDLDLARLQGQVEAYQEQMRSLSIELLRTQVERLRQSNSELERAMELSQLEFGRYKAEVDDRLAKASTAWKELNVKLKELETK